jgi:AmmeMemoRadiSam system protein B/AmmeMemoRadiSam system protein A
MKRSVVLALAFPLLCAPARAGRVREPALSGSWYPESRALATVTAHHLMRAAAAAPALPGKPVALIVPHAGWQYSGVAAGAAFRNLHPGDFERVVVVAPSHHGGFEGYSLDDASAYRTPLGEVPLCPRVFSQLQDGQRARVVPRVAGPEHAIEIELPFLQATLGRFCLVPVLAGRTSAEDERAMAERLARLDDGRTLFVFSSDFTHYGLRYDYAPFGASALPVLDKIRAQDEQAALLIGKLDAAGFRAFLNRTGATICGQAAINTALELVPRLAPKARAMTLAHYASAELPFARDASSVDYLALAFVREEIPAASPLRAPPTPVVAVAPQLASELGARLVRLARTAIEAEILGKGGLSRELAGFPEGLEGLQAVFVTLNRTDPAEVRVQGRLRGCIGQVEPTYPVYFAVVRAAVEAALQDPRFTAVTGKELPRLEVEVTLLSPPRPVASWKAIELGRHGMVLEKGGRKALFLPQVAIEQGWNLHQALTALAEKAGLPRDAWREGARFSVFTGQVFKEEHR